MFLCSQFKLFIGTDTYGSNLSAASQINDQKHYNYLGADQVLLKKQQNYCFMITKLQCNYNCWSSKIQLKHKKKEVCLKDASDPHISFFSEFEQLQ